MKTKQERSVIFKEFQTEIKKKNTFDNGKIKLLELRKELKTIYDYIFENCKKEDYSKMPLKNDKTIAFYIYHLARIEDINANTLILNKEQIFFKNIYNQLIKSPIITTGNELDREELIHFSSLLDLKQLKNYVYDVLDNTNKMIKNMTFEETKNIVPTERKNNLVKLNVVSTDENAFWLVDYWCKKTYVGLFLMPFSRHHMLHLDGCLRIMARISK